MLELIKTSIGILCLSVGFTLVASAVILGIGLAVSSFSKSKSEDEGPLDPPAA